MKKALVLALLLGLAALCGCRSNLDLLDDTDGWDDVDSTPSLLAA